MDTSTTPTSDSSLSTTQAGAAFAELLDPVVEKKEPEVPTQSDAEKAAAAAKENAVEEGADADPAPEDSETVTVLVDGKPVELTKAQIAEAHKNGLRQADYTRKTMEVSEQRKAAEAETNKAREERQQLAQALQRSQVQLEGALQEQNQINWQALLDSDPVEYLKQQHLAQSRQAALQQNFQQQQYLSAQAKAEQDASLASHLQNQREQLLAKIPEWKDEAKQKAGTAEIANYLMDMGFPKGAVLGEFDASGRQISHGITDHLPIVLARKAMLYDQMIGKASAAAKKVASLPQRVERPSGGESQGLDRRATAYQRLSKSGSVNDAAAVFSSLL